VKIVALAAVAALAFAIAARGEGPVATLIAAGDIAVCGTSGDEATAELVKGIPGTVATLGDNAYESGTNAEYDRCYAPTWGRFKARTRPVPGNHEYRTEGAAGYFDYFGARAGKPATGWYTYRLGAWRVIALNSNCGSVGGCGRGSLQERWLRSVLKANRATKCTLAYWHHPRFSSGAHGSSTALEPLWRALYEAGADVVLTGHDHNYERFAPQTPAGRLDRKRGIRAFVVGTGGRSLRSLGKRLPTTVVRNDTAHGVLVLTLQPGSYSWRFVPVAGSTFSDRGSGACH